VLWFILLFIWKGQKGKQKNANITVSVFNQKNALLLYPTHWLHAPWPAALNPLIIFLITRALHAMACTTHGLGFTIQVKYCTSGKMNCTM
jgi:hypothetical protein